MVTLQGSTIRESYSSDIPFLAFFRLNDFGAAVTANVESEFIRLLGLCIYSGCGTDKLGYCALKDSAGVRGWLVDNTP